MYCKYVPVSSQPLQPPAAPAAPVETQCTMHANKRFLNHKRQSDAIVPPSLSPTTTATKLN